jgi:oxygen-dependent protoporphyrinogen oxidase
MILRVFLGGARRPEMAELPAEELRRAVYGELRRLVGIRGEAHYEDLARWPRTMPQYHVGHLVRVAEIERRVADLPGLELAGNALRGVGLPDCIHGGELAAERALG